MHVLKAGLSGRAQHEVAKLEAVSEAALLTLYPYVEAPVLKHDSPLLAASLSISLLEFREVWMLKVHVICIKAPDHLGYLINVTIKALLLARHSVYTTVVWVNTWTCLRTQVTLQLFFLGHHIPPTFVIS